MTKAVYFAVFVLLLSFVHSTKADQAADEYSYEEKSVEQPDPLSPTARITDKRLPAVLPGEAVKTDTGRKMKVWTTAGPVPVESAPEPWKCEGGCKEHFSADDATIIIDGRKAVDAPRKPSHPE